MDEDNDVEPGATEGSAPPTRAPHACGGGAEAGQGKRFSAKRKRAAVQRLMRGESLGALHQLRHFAPSRKRLPFESVLWRDTYFSFCLHKKQICCINHRKLIHLL